ncbi:MAG: S-adenosylmethionine:tRNA ribosyltransferase-isomerase, partial [Proteobacteria bacterium]|nr:S-adenosylmethionine:tRNA ribosyltransferase-isomerase [Pseudomonadota bacterium]
MKRVRTFPPETMNLPLATRLFDYSLPDELIAQRPADERSGSRLLAMDRFSGDLAHLGFEGFPGLLRPGDLVVLNDTRVFPARLMTRREAGGVVEVFLLHYPSGEGKAPCLVRPARRIRDGEKLFLPDGSALMISREGESFSVSGDPGDLEKAVKTYGRVPLPPYIRRGEAGPDLPDEERYQTIFARNIGAVAAPTAGLHFDDMIFRRIIEKGAKLAWVTL